MTTRNRATTAAHVDHRNKAVNVGGGVLQPAETPKGDLMFTDELVATITSARRARMVEMENFIEEQNVRRSLGPALWNNLCNEFEDECRNLNNVEKRFLIEKTAPTTRKIRDLRTGRVLRLQYEGLAGNIAYEFGREKGNIGFQLSTDPVPSLICQYNGTPYQAHDLVYEIMKDFVG
jgi:hypothetical protein